MKFVASSSTLLQHLLTVNGAIMSKPIIPILENFLFEVKGGELHIYSTDLETSSASLLGMLKYGSLARSPLPDPQTSSHRQESRTAEIAFHS